MPFRVPAGIKLIRVDAKTGMRVGPGGRGQGDPRGVQARHRAARHYSVIGYTDQQQQTATGSAWVYRCIA